MIEVTNANEQTLAPGQEVSFDTVVVSRNTGCKCQTQGTSFRISGSGLYQIMFSANVAATSATTEAQLSIQINGTTLSEATAVSTSVAAGDVHNVFAYRFYSNCCSNFSNVSIVNTGTSKVVVTNPNLSIVKISN